MEKITVTILSYNEFDDLVHKTFPGRVDYEFIAEQEAHNDTCYLFKNINADADDDDEKDLSRWLKKMRPSFFGSYQILAALCRRSVILPGDYLVRVSW